MKVKEFLEIAEEGNAVRVYYKTEFYAFARYSNGTLSEEAEELKDCEITKIDIGASDDEWDAYDYWLDVTIDKLPFDEEKWINSMLDEFTSSRSNITIATHWKTVFILNAQNPAHMGWSKCSRKDAFNVNKGIAIAWARYMNYKIPEEL